MKNKVLVSGGTGGIGQGVVNKLLERDMEVVIFDKKRVSNLSYERVTCFEVDLCDREQLKLAVRDLEGGDISHLISLHGGALAREFGPLEQLSDGDVEASINLNLSSHLNLIFAILPLLYSSTYQDKSITLVSSINAISGYGLPIYSAAKAGMKGAVVSMTKELGSRGIRINSVLPGTVPTPRTITEEPKDFSALKEGTALKRLSSIEEVATAIVAVALDFRSMTGQELVIDAGQSTIR